MDEQSRETSLQWVTWLKRLWWVDGITRCGGGWIRRWKALLGNMVAFIRSSFVSSPPREYYSGNWQLEESWKTRLKCIDRRKLRSIFSHISQGLSRTFCLLIDIHGRFNYKPKTGAITSDDDNQQLGNVDGCKVHSAWQMTYSGKEPLPLKDVSTVRKMLEVGVLRRASKAWEGIKPNDELLDRIAFQRVPLLIIDR